MAADPAPPSDTENTDVPEKEDAGPVIRPFADVLREQGKGTLHEELTEKFHQLVGGVVDTGKKGTITLRLEVAPMKGNPEVLTMVDKVAVAVPTVDRRPSIFYADEFGNLTKTDPNQPQLSGLKIAGKKDTK